MCIVILHVRNEEEINLFQPNEIIYTPRYTLYIHDLFTVWVSMHHKLIYIKRTNVMQLGSLIHHMT